MIITKTKLVYLVYLSNNNNNNNKNNKHNFIRFMRAYIHIIIKTSLAQSDRTYVYIYKCAFTYIKRGKLIHIHITNNEAIFC